MISTSFESSFFVKFTASYNFSIQWLWDYSVSFSVLKTNLIWNIQGLLDHQSVFECLWSTKGPSNRALKKKFFCPFAFQVLWGLKNTLVKTVFQNIAGFVEVRSLKDWSRLPTAIKIPDRNCMYIVCIYLIVSEMRKFFFKTLLDGPSRFIYYQQSLIMWGE